MSFAGRSVADKNLAGGSVLVALAHHVVYRRPARPR
jgi:hypothetical protein